MSKKSRVFFAVLVLLCLNAGCSKLGKPVAKPLSYYNVWTTKGAVTVRFDSVNGDPIKTAKPGDVVTGYVWLDTLNDELSGGSVELCVQPAYLKYVDFAPTVPRTTPVWARYAMLGAPVGEPYTTGTLTRVKIWYSKQMKLTFWPPFYYVDSKAKFNGVLGKIRFQALSATPLEEQNGAMVNVYSPIRFRIVEQAADERIMPLNYKNGPVGSVKVVPK